MWERTVDGRVLSFKLAGINNQNFIMQDRETGSWWQQVSGAALLGPLKGKRLTRVFHDELSFREWTREHPGGRVLLPSADTAWQRVATNWEDSTARRPVRVHVRLDRRLPPRTVVYGIEAGGAAKAYPQDRVWTQAPLHDRLGGVPLVLLVGADGKSVRAFEARVEGRELELVKPAAGAAGEVVDLGSGSHWDFSGEAVSGPLKGRRLKAMYLLRDYWFDWFTYHPDTAIYLRGS